ncbi:MAG: hypothetical protein COA71_12935 [SAR86 cluster bacterium]|uniref:DUF3500 domain-containing protein n=1 Tax=SAR86 cluster bacterium TaxID=2030880 RepID=A0A2A5C8T6_9GAMM|nr:MAG: hypothetical protein COA71_12935 [SAR86 cluster bacterium]
MRKIQTVQQRVIRLVQYMTICLFSISVSAQNGVEVPEEFRNASRMTEKANLFLASLSIDERSEVLRPIDSIERGNWSNLPNGIVERNGLRLGNLSETQRIAMHDLLRASLSSQGYLKVTGIMHMDEVLGESLSNPPEGLMGIDVGGFDPGPVEAAGLTAGLTDDDGQALDIPPLQFGTGNYWVSIFNMPSQDQEWGWLIGGHHLAVSFTVSEGRVAFTPLFLGSQPLMLRRGVEAGWSPLYHESQRGFDLMQSLNSSQREIALQSEERVYDVIVGPGRRDSLGGFEGLKASQMSPEQKLLLRLVVLEYVGNADYSSAQMQIEAIEETGWDELWFSWRGPVNDQDDLFYYRVHGQRILIELAWEARNHIHAIVRDPINDYGEDWLGRHYIEDHPDISALMEQIRAQIKEGEAGLAQ